MNRLFYFNSHSPVLTLIIKAARWEIILNIEINKSPETLVRRNFFMHKYKGGSANNYQGKGELKQFSHDNFLIKVYDKGKQFELESNVLRFEIKFIKLMFNIRFFEFVKLMVIPK